MISHDRHFCPILAHEFPLLHVLLHLVQRKSPKTRPSPWYGVSEINSEKHIFTIIRPLSAIAHFHSCCQNKQWYRTSEQVGTTVFLFSRRDWIKPQNWHKCYIPWLKTATSFWRQEFPRVIPRYSSYYI